MASTESSDRKELKAAVKTEAEVPVLSLADVAKHNTKDDLWIVVHGKVYDVTEYARDHPGGADTLIEVAGTDATSAYEDVGHSQDANEIMLGFMVGSLEGGESGAAAASVKVYPQPSKPAEDATSASTWLHPTLELSLFAVGTAGLVYFARHSKTLTTVGRRISAMATPQSSSHSTSFAQGFLLASATASVIGLAAARYLSSLVKMGGDFTKYPAHITASPTYRAPHIRGSIHPTEYRQFTLTAKEELSKGIFRFVFSLPKSTSVLGLPIGQHIAIRGPVGEETVFRSYTPVSSNKDLGRIELLIRVYQDGKLTGGYLESLKVGDKVDIRGPKGAMKYRKGMSKALGMVGGGTGITPLFQLIRAICEDPTDGTEISLVYANRSEGDILLRKQLERFSETSGGKFKVHFMLDHPSEEWRGGKGYVTKDVLEEHMPKPGPDTKILLCGPPGMVNATKKNLVDLGFKAPGAVSKMQDEIFMF